MVNTIGLQQQIRITQICKSDVSRNISRLQYFTQSVQQVLRPGTCCSRRLIFWYHFWDHIVELCAKLGAYTQNRVCGWLCTFVKKNVRCIGKSIVYFNTLLFFISSFTIWILQIFQSYLFHRLVGTYYFDFNIFNSFYFHFWNIIPQHLLVSWKIQVWCLTSDYKAKVRIKHQKSVWWTQLVCSIKGVKPTFVNWLFLSTLVISGT